MATPAESPVALSRSRSSSCSSIDSEYFFKTYVPLTNLPTPPPSSHSDLGDISRDELSSGFFPPGGNFDPELLGSAIHLINLIPSSTSLTVPSISLVHSILTRAALPVEFVAFAVCILDSLNSRFALSWRQGCPLEPKLLPGRSPLRVQPPQSQTSLPSNSKSSFLLFSAETYTKQHIDTIHPELIILSALILAAKFLDDNICSTLEYAEYWGYGIWSCEQINFSQKCVLENLGYRLLVMWDRGIIDAALEDMRKAGVSGRNEKMADRRNNCISGDCQVVEAGRIPTGLPMSKGKATVGVGQQLTPAETPMGENICGTKDVDMETKAAFSRPIPLAHRGKLTLPTKPIEPREPFPGFVDLMSGEAVMF